MKSGIVAFAMFALTGSIALGQEAWQLAAGVTPQTLSGGGATLTSTDAMTWPDGPTVFVTYWLGPGDALFRCADLSAGGQSSVTCWQRDALVSASGAATGLSVVRRISTRRRPYIHRSYSQPYRSYPFVWVGAHR